MSIESIMSSPATLYRRASRGDFGAGAGDEPQKVLRKTFGKLMPGSQKRIFRDDRQVGICEHLVLLHPGDIDVLGRVSISGESIKILGIRRYDSHVEIDGESIE